MKKLGKIKDLLSREEMKQIQGGSGGGSCVRAGALCITNKNMCCSGLKCVSTTVTWGLCG